MRDTLGHLVEKLPDVCRDGLVAGAADESFPGMDEAGRCPHGVLVTMALSCGRARVRRQLSSSSQVDGPPTGLRIAATSEATVAEPAGTHERDLRSRFVPHDHLVFCVHDCVPSRGNVTSCTLVRSTVWLGHPAWPEEVSAVSRAAALCVLKYLIMNLFCWGRLWGITEQNTKDAREWAVVVNV